MDSRGSEATWYRGKACALVQLAADKFGPESLPFKFKSRAKHSAYKEGECCKSRQGKLRSCLIRERAPPQQIKEAERELSEHLQWMLLQRRCLERITHMAANERMIVENSDKCGDGCLHGPWGGGRLSGDNASRYRYRLSLQANVFANKLFHLTFLLPGLRTGVNFGITTFLTGICRLIRLGRISNQERNVFRGFDGDSANMRRWLGDQLYIGQRALL